MAPRTLRRFTAGALPVAVLLGLVLLSLHLMSSAVQNTEELSRLFVPLLVASILGLIAMVVVVGVNIAQLFMRYRRQAAGSMLTIRLVVLFAVLSLAPVTVVFYYSQQFLSQGIESWFNVQVDQAMENALALSRASLGLHKREKLRSTHHLLSELRATSEVGLSISLADLRQKYGASELVLMEPGGKALVVSNADPTLLVHSAPDSSILQQVRGGGDFVGLVPKGTGDSALLEVRVVVYDEQRGKLLQAMYPTSTNVSDLTETLEGAYNRYKELSFLRKSLKNTFTMALALVMLFSLLAAVWAAFFTARRLVEPVANIAEGTKAVAKGDYDKRLPPTKTRDELGFLVASFNEMTRRIAQARDEAHRSQRQVEAQRAYLEAVLSRLSTGVLVLDGNADIRTANGAAAEILRVDAQNLVGRPLSALTEASSSLQQFIDVIEAPIAEQRHDWREQVNLYGGDGRQVLLCRGTPLVQQEERAAGYVLVFDDITTLIAAQRDAAWGEVARRLAHEIKNPLTPIQLAAERLRHKYLHKMAAKDSGVLDRATHTIVQQVEAMKEMVNAFSDYARPPQMNSRPMELDALVSTVLDLYRSAVLQPALSAHLNAGGARIEADPVRLRQVVHNLVKNAQEAVADEAKPEVEIATEQVREAGCSFVELRVSDNGPGFDEDTLTHLFEPYVTTKVKGTGLGLAIVKKIVEEHGGLIWAENRSERGACVILRPPMLGAEPGGGPGCLPAPESAKRTEDNT